MLNITVAEKIEQKKIEIEVSQEHKKKKMQFKCSFTCNVRLAFI